MKTGFLLGITATTFLSSTAVPADTRVITTQDYVDTRVETKQDKISARGTDDQYNVPMPNSVIIDTDTDGVVAKRFIVEPSDDGILFYEDGWLGDWLASNVLSTYVADDTGLNANDIKKSIVPVGVLEEAFAQIQRQLKVKQQTKVCVRYLDGAAETSENCLLWELPD